MTKRIPPTPEQEATIYEAAYFAILTHFEEIAKYMDVVDEVLEDALNYLCHDLGYDQEEEE